MVSWGSMNNRSNFHNGGIVSWGSNNRGMVSWGSMDNRGMVSWGSMHNRGMVSWGSMHNRSMISWSSMNNWSMVSWSSMDNWGSMIDWGRGGMIDWGRGISFFDGKSSWCNGSSSRLLVATIAMYRLRSSMGLAYNRGMYSSMGLVDRVADSRSISLLDALVMGLVSSNNRKEGDTDKSLHVSVQELRIE